MSNLTNNKKKLKEINTKKSLAKKIYIKKNKNKKILKYIFKKINYLFNNRFDQTLTFKNFITFSKPIIFFMRITNRFCDQFF